MASMARSWSSLHQVNRINFRKLLYVIPFTLILLSNLTHGDEHYRDFASKTRYIYEEKVSSRLPSLCRPVHINMVIRHGTRQPSKKDVKKINGMAQALNALFSEQRDFQIGNLTLPWTSPYSDRLDKMLTDIGKQELYDMARRIRNRYPELLHAAKSLEQFRFVSTNTHRCLQSAQSFSFGLFEGAGILGPCKMHPVAIETQSVHNDPVLRFFDLCPKYKTQVSENKSSLYEHHAFKQSLAMGHVVEHIRRQLGSADSITVKHVIGMYIACAFEVAVFDRTDTWCAVFRAQDLQVMEFFYDLKHYWKRGYGYNVNYKISCVLLENIITTIKAAVDNESTHKTIGIFRFAHAETLQPLYAVLGLFQDKEPLTASNFDKRRQYRTSRISPFGANIAFVVYNCSDSLQLQVLANEQPIWLPCCGLTCPLEKFYKCFHETTHNCSIDSLCTVDNEHGKKRAHDDL